MTTQPNGENASPDDRSAQKQEILDLLLDALLERHAERRRQAAAARHEAPSRTSSVGQPAARRSADEKAAQVSDEPRAPQPGDPDWQPPPAEPSIGLHRTVGRLLLLVLALAALINIPVTRYGVALARLLPDPEALVIRDGLLLKGSGPEVYVLEDDALHWVSSLDAFAHRGYAWDDVHIVENEVIAGFEQGEPYHVLLKCKESPHIYRLENDHKRWIRDIPTFRREGHVWEEVRFVDCAYLRSIPMGPPIPQDAGPSPQP